MVPWFVTNSLTSGHIKPLQRQNSDSCAETKAVCLDTGTNLCRALEIKSQTQIITDQTLIPSHYISTAYIVDIIQYC